MFKSYCKYCGRLDRREGSGQCMGCSQQTRVPMPKFMRFEPKKSFMGYNAEKRMVKKIH
jgi:hypothetical protein